MLVITRKMNQSIVIGDSIEIQILGKNGEAVRLGITAPPEIRVKRKEAESAKS